MCLNVKTHTLTYLCYQFRSLRNLRIDIKDRVEEYSQSLVLDIHVVLKSISLHLLVIHISLRNIKDKQAQSL